MERRQVPVKHGNQETYPQFIVQIPRSFVGKRNAAWPCSRAIWLGLGRWHLLISQRKGSTERNLCVTVFPFLLPCCLFYLFFLLSLKKNFFNFTILYWFCHISTWICHRYTRGGFWTPSWTLLRSPSLYHPSESSRCTSPKHPVSCIEPGLATHFIYDIIHVSVSFFQIIPPSPSPTESKRLFYTCVSFAVSYTGLLLPSF